MTKIIHFVPTVPLDAEKNLQDFILACRTELFIFGQSLDFDSKVWTVTEECARKGQGDKAERITFCTLESVRSCRPVEMDQEFGPFARAYIRYQQGMAPVVGLGSRMSALRALEAALVTNGAGKSPALVDAAIFNLAASLVRENFAAGSAYRIGMQLEMVADFLQAHDLVFAQFKWKSPIRRPKEGMRVGKEADENRLAKMPSQAALDALPKAFRLAYKPKHVLATSIAAILCSAPDRINELLGTTINCEVVETRSDGREAYGLRWPTSKGGAPMVKWVIPTMSSVVRDAIQRIRTVTEPAREIAAWYETHPNQIFLKTCNEFLRSKELINMNELNAILWGGRAKRTVPAQWCTDNKIDMPRIGGKLYVPFSAVERFVLTLLPSSFPFYDKVGLVRFSEALCVIQLNEMHSAKATYDCMIEAIVIQHVNDGLGARSEFGVESVFDALDLADEHGNSISVTTKQFRHYLNTLAQLGGLSQLDIAKWSGRVDINQNKAYDHVTVEQMLEKVRSTTGRNLGSVLPGAAKPRNVMIPRDQFGRLDVTTAHITDLGYCGHDYTMSPCQLHRDCIHCYELECRKGDEKEERKLKMNLRDARSLLDQAKQAVNENCSGADRWVMHHERTVEKLKQIAAIYDDPTIPVGAIFRLNVDGSVSRISEALERRVEFVDDKLISYSVADLERIRALTQENQDEEPIKA